MVRVAHVLDSLHLGGTETQCVALVRGLAARGIENRLVHFRAGPLRDQLDVPNVTVDRLDFDGFLKPGFVRLVRRLAKDLRAWQADVVQAYGFYTNLPAVLAGRVAGVPVRVAGKRGFDTHLTPAQRRVDRLARRLAHTTVVNSEALRVRVAAEAGPGNVTVIPNCVVERGPVAPAQDPIVGMVANFHPPKDQLTFLRAAAIVSERVPTAEFHLVGSGPNEPEARALAEELGLGARVRFLGSLPPHEVWAALNRFAVSVLSSQSEGMPNTVLEAMLAARPVVATNVPGVAEVLEHGVAGYLVPPRDASALAAPITELLEDPGRAASMGAAGRRHVLGAHGPDRMVDGFLELWHALGAEGRAA
jgi:glycosyltransferase involved in cell wall biosynthesis